MRPLLLFLALIATGFALESPLGLPTTLNDVYIPGKKVEPIPRKDFSSSIVVRILDIKPAADGFRYDFSLYGLDPGTHSLKDYLQYIHDKSPVTQLTQNLTITTVKPLDTLPAPEKITHNSPPKLGGYRLLIITLGVLWFLILLAILFYKKKNTEVREIPKKEPTLKERLIPLVLAAAKNDLDDQERATLERLILGHWKEQLPEKSLAELRQHPESSPLLLQLENWLHSPNPSINQLQISTLLAPYGK